MAAQPTPNQDYDSPWKELLQSHFREFMTLMFPDAAAEIDWSRQPEFLDKELRKVVRDAHLGRRLADKLVRVWLKTGEEIWVLCHIEVQTQSEEAFEERIYIYNYRFFDRFGRRVASFVILADDDPSWRPHEFGYDLWGTKVLLRFRTVKLLDVCDRLTEEILRRNPFAMVVWAHVRAKETRGHHGARLHWKVVLVKQMHELGYKPLDILAIFRFIDWVMPLPNDLEDAFMDRMSRLEEEKQVRYVTSVERRAIRKGRLEGETLLLRRQLTHRFGPLPGWVIERLNAATVDDLETWGLRLFDATSIADVFNGQSM